MDGYVISILHDKLEQREKKLKTTTTIRSGRREKLLQCGEFRNVCFPQHADQVPNLQQTRWTKTKLSAVFSVRALNTQRRAALAEPCAACAAWLCWQAACRVRTGGSQKAGGDRSQSADWFSPDTHIIPPPPWWEQPKVWLLLSLFSLLFFIIFII